MTQVFIKLPAAWTGKQIRETFLRRGRGLRWAGAEWGCWSWRDETHTGQVKWTKVPRARVESITRGDHQGDAPEGWPRGEVTHGASGEAELESRVSSPPVSAFGSRVSPSGDGPLLLAIGQLIQKSTVTSGRCPTAVQTLGAHQGGAAPGGMAASMKPGTS